MSEVISTVFGYVMIMNDNLDCYQAIVVNGKSECAVYINKSLMEK